MLKSQACNFNTKESILLQEYMHHPLAEFFMHLHRWKNKSSIESFSRNCCAVINIMIEHYSVSELSDGRNQTHTLLFPEQPDTCKEHRNLTMAATFKQGGFGYLDYVTIRHFPLLASLNSNSCSLLFHFFQETCSEAFNTDQDEGNNPILGLIKTKVLN